MNIELAEPSQRRMDKAPRPKGKADDLSSDDGLGKLSSDDIVGLNAKDRGTWNRVWPVLWPIALRKASKMLRSEEGAKDAATDALGDLFQKEWERPLRDLNHLRRRTLIAVRNRCVSEHRGNKVRHDKWRIVAIGEDFYGRLGNIVGTPSSDIQQNELKEVLCRLLGRLRKEEYRQWIDDHILKGMTIDEIVSQYQRPRGTVSGYIDRAKAALLTMAEADPKMQEFKETYHVGKAPVEGDNSNK